MVKILVNASTPRLCKDLNLVETHKCSLLIMGLHIFEVKLCDLNSSVGAALCEITFVVPHGFINQKLKKL